MFGFGAPECNLCYISNATQCTPSDLKIRNTPFRIEGVDADKFIRFGRLLRVLL